jgi:hypothetical protein
MSHGNGGPPPSLLDPASRLPVVGLPMKPHGGYIFAAFTCLCRPDNKPELIRGADLAVECPHCRNRYQIAAAHFDIREGKPPVIAIVCLGKG